MLTSPHVKLYENAYSGQVPRTPSTPYTVENSMLDTLKTLMDNSLHLGYPVGYIQEQNGALIQNIVPVHKTEYDQISTSSKVNLVLHTETAFHPYKPDYVLLLCLRGDPMAVTTYADIDDILTLLDQETISILQENWYQIGIDDSFKEQGKKYQTINISILKKNNKEYKFTYDEVLIEPINDKAKKAMTKLADAVQQSVQGIILKTGDLLIMDNRKVIHGRKPFQPRYDGTDRWLQRMLVRKQLPPADQIDGRIITTKFLERTE